MQESAQYVSPESNVSAVVTNRKSAPRDRRLPSITDEFGGYFTPTIVQQEKPKAVRISIDEETETMQLAYDVKPKTRVNLLEDYEPHSSVYFASSTQSLLAKPPFASLLVKGFNGLEHQVRESLRFAKELGFSKPVVVGAVPFDIDEKSYLRVSTNYQKQDRDRVKNSGAVVSGDAQSELVPVSVVALPAPETYIANVKQALEKFAKGELNKVVLSRTLEVKCQSAPDVKHLVKKLSVRNTLGYTFAVNMKDVGKETADTPVHALIGASPELLISRTGKQIVAHPLAGSEPRHTDPLIDQQNAQRLLRSTKDRYEHALVINAIKEALTPFCETLSVPEEPSLVSTATMWHLATKIEGKLTSENTTSMQLALAMHPTPAVGGYPMEEAKEAIKDIETHQRDLFTGMVGWTDETGDGEWVVTIRCAEVKEKLIRLYAGAGIVEGSLPEKELAETGAKFNTMLNAMGISPSHD